MQCCTTKNMSFNHLHITMHMNTLKRFVYITINSSNMIRFSPSWTNYILVRFSPCLIMAKATHVKVVKTLLLIILLVIFFFLFFLQVVMQYSEKFTNTAKIEQNAESIEMQTISICTGFRESVMKKYGITTQIFFLPPDQDSNLPSNATVRSVFDDTTFKINR